MPQNFKLRVSKTLSKIGSAVSQPHQFFTVCELILGYMTKLLHHCDLPFSFE
jgi:hypothetical protein